RTGAAQHRARRVAGERVELRANLDRNVVRQQVAPNAGRVLEDEKALITESRSRVAADRSARRRVIEALARAVVVDDDDRGRVSCCGSEQQESAEQERDRAA